MPWRWQFKGSPNNLPTWWRNQRIVYGLKSSGDHFQNTYEKKLEDDSNVEECTDYQTMPISWELPPNSFIPDQYLILALVLRELSTHLFIRWEQFHMGSLTDQSPRTEKTILLRSVYNLRDPNVPYGIHSWS